MVSTQLQSELTQPRASEARASLFWTAFTWVYVLSCLFFGAIVAIVAGGVARLLGDRHGRVAHACVTAAYKIIVRYHPHYRLTLSGMENLPPGAAVLCANHQSLSDVVYLFSLPLPYRWIIKRELFAIPMFGAAMRLACYPAIERGNLESAMDLVDQVGALLDAGIPVLSFPEGTRSHDGQLGRFRSGPARMALLKQVPLVPVGVIGTDYLLPRGSFSYPARAHISIHVGPPIETRDYGPRGIRLLNRELRARVEAAKLAAQRAVDATAGVS
jgi:1-acyl-sn-glycerol-3-phosphate acyltransferase